MNKPYGVLYCYFVQGSLFSRGILQIIVYEQLTFTQSFYFSYPNLMNMCLLEVKKYIYNCKDQ